MPKDDKKEKGLKLAGSPDKMISLVITDEKMAKHATDEINHEGPPHKHALFALLLNKVYELVERIAATSGQSFEPMKGAAVIKKDKKNGRILPVTLAGVKDKKMKGLLAEAIGAAHQPAGIGMLLAKTQ